MCVGEPSGWKCSYAMYVKFLRKRHDDFLVGLDPCNTVVNWYEGHLLNQTTKSFPAMHLSRWSAGGVVVKGLVLWRRSCRVIAWKPSGLSLPYWPDPKWAPKAGPASTVNPLACPPSQTCCKGSPRPRCAPTHGRVARARRIWFQSKGEATGGSLSVVSRVARPHSAHLWFHSLHSPKMPENPRPPTR